MKKKTLKFGLFGLFGVLLFCSGCSAPSDTPDTPEPPIVEEDLPPVYDVPSSAITITKEQYFEKQSYSYTYNGTACTLPYRIFKPIGYTEEGGKYPVLIFFHGAGERGNDNSLQLKLVLQNAFNDLTSPIYSSIVIAPQCPTGKQWVDTPWANGDYNYENMPISQAMTGAVGILNNVISTYHVDEDRVYASGVSMGGFGTWYLAMSHPEKIAAIVPLCGGASKDNAFRLNDMPVTTYHGDKDSVVPVAGTRAMVNALRTLGSTDVNYTELPGYNHDIWGYVGDHYPAQWLFSKKHSDWYKTSTGAITNIYNSSNSVVGYPNKTTIVSNAKHFSSEFISVSAGDVIKFGPCNPIQNFHLASYDNNNSATEISNSDLARAGVIGGYNFYSYLVPNNVNRIRVVGMENVRYKFVTTKNHRFLNVDYASWCEANNQNDIVNVYDRHDSNRFVGYLTGQNPVQQHSYEGHITTGFINVKANDYIYFGPCRPGQGYHVYEYTNISNNIGRQVANSVLTEVDTTKTIIADNSDYGYAYKIYKYKVPSDVVALRLSDKVTPNSIDDIYTVSINQPFTFKEISQDMNDTLRNTFGSYIEKKNGKLNGKSALFVGDSICYGSGTGNMVYTNKGWAGRIGDRNNMDYKNAGVSGASISTIRGNNRILPQLQNNSSRNYDYIMIHGGVNDAWDSATVGTKNSTDTSTYAGGLRELLNYAKTTWPNAKIAYIINFKAPNKATGNIQNMDMYFSVGRQICTELNIPYLDLYNNNEVTNQLRVNTQVYLPDNIHPNNGGYDVLYPFIESFMESL